MTDHKDPDQIDTQPALARRIAELEAKLAKAMADGQQADITMTYITEKPTRLTWRSLIAFAVGGILVASMDYGDVWLCVGQCDALAEQRGEK